jgi:hypothetical protein
MPTIPADFAGCIKGKKQPGQHGGRGRREDRPSQQVKEVKHG